MGSLQDPRLQQGPALDLYISPPPLPHCHTPGLHPSPPLRAAFIYLMRGSIQTQLNAYPLYTPAATWVPSSNLPCPGQCFSLTYFTFISTSVAVCWLQLLFDRRRSLVT